MDPKFEAIMQGLQDTMTVMEGLQRRQAERQAEHQKWLEDLQFAWSKHNQAWQRHEEWLIEHDRAMAEMDVKLNNLIENIDRFVQGRNIN
jgi:hypothetical protein